MDFLSSTTQKLFEKSLDGLSLRHQAISSNVANVDTPGYRKMVVDFESQLTEALQESQATPPNPGELKQTDPRHMDSQGRTPVESTESNLERLQFEYRQDQNGVDIESEMVSMAKNTQRYMAVSHLQNKSFEGLNKVIQSQGG